MNVGIAIRHPEHVRFYRQSIAELTDRGHDVTLMVREFRNTTALLDRFGLEYALLADEASGLASLLAGHARFERGVLREGRRTGVDVLSSVGGRAVSHLAPLLGVPSVVFADWEPGTTDRVVAQLADVVATPSFLRGEFGPNQVVYDGLHELAYLRPEQYQLPPRISDGGEPGGPTAVVGFTADCAESNHVAGTVAALADRGTVLDAGEHVPSPAGAVTSHLSSESIHDELAAADLCVTDLGTLATEAAVLGTPTLFVGPDPPRRCQYLARHYQLIQVTDETSLEATALDRLNDDDAATLWRRRQRLLLEESVDVTDFVVDQLVAEAGR